MLNLDRDGIVKVIEDTSKVLDDLKERIENGELELLEQKEMLEEQLELMKAGVRNMEKRGEMGSKVILQ